MAGLRVHRRWTFRPHTILLSTAQPDPEWKSDAQFAMESGWFCVVCGSPFDLEGEVYNLDAKAPRYSWMYELRLLATARDVHHHNLDALSDEEAEFQLSCKNVSSDPNVFLSRLASWSVTGDHFFHVHHHVDDPAILPTMSFSALDQIHDHDTVFPMHEHCLQIARRAIDSVVSTVDVGQDTSSCTVLNKVLQSRYRDRAKQSKAYDLIARKDVLNLCTSSSSEGPRSVIGLSLLEWWAGDYERFYTDPINIPDLTTCMFSMLQGSSSAYNKRPCPSLPIREPHGLERLPAELLDQICGYVSIDSAIAMQRTSRSLSLKMPLDNNFWRKSIISGKLLPYLWDLDVEELDRLRQDQLESSSNSDPSWDWRGVGQLLVTKHFPLKNSNPRLVDIPNGLWNRRRIWNIIEEACKNDFPEYSNKKRSDSTIEERKHREPVFQWQLEEIMDDLGHFS